MYFPVNTGLDYTETDAGGSAALGVVLSGNFVGSRNEFAKVAYSSHVSASFGKAGLSANRDQKLPAGFSLFARANGQFATGALINNEQFALGGVNSVRGYYEGDEYGDGGWCGSVELRSPYFETQVAGLTRPVPIWLRASVFTDCGQPVLLQQAAGVSSTGRLWGTGFGLSANVNNHWDARVVIAWPLLSSANTARGETRASFSIGGQF
jgi:hemolysin activation/secretion protein